MRRQATECDKWAHLINNRYLGEYTLAGLPEVLKDGYFQRSLQEKIADGAQ